MVTKKIVKSEVVTSPKVKSVTTKPKAPSKTGASKVALGKKLVVANDAHCFWLSDGKILKDLRDLESAFKTMTPAVFSHHVNKEKNDFASWVEVILKDKACATDLRKAKKASTAKTAVAKHLKNYAK